MTDMATEGHPESRWRPHGRVAWLVAASAWLLASLVLVTAWYMVDPVDYGGVGWLGWAGFLLGPRILLATAVGAVLAELARRRHELAAMGGFLVVTVATLVIVVVPSVLVWRQAARYHVSLSLVDALAPRLESGAGGDGQSVAYATSSDGTRLELDVWLAHGGGTSSGLRPAIVKVHGGAWTRGAVDGHSDWNRWLNRLGYDVFDVEYALPPRASWRSEVGDVKCALRWVQAHAADYDVDPARISTMGYSAGGNLAMLAAYGETDARLPASCSVGSPVHVRSVINLYGPTDLSMLFRTSGSRSYIDRALVRYIGGTPSAYPGRYRSLSPVFHVGAQSPPTITLIGESDRIVPESQARVLDRALARVHVPHPTYALPATDHGFDVDWHGLSTQIARSVIERFLARYG